MRTWIRWTAILVFLACAVPGRAEESPAETEAAKWAVEEASDEARLGQNDTTLSAIGRIQLADLELTAEDREHLETVNVGVFHASRLLRRQGWIDRAMAFQVRIADASVLDWLRKNKDVKLIQAQGRLRVDGKYFLIEDCRPADEKPIVAPAKGRGKRSGM